MILMLIPNFNFCFVCNHHQLENMWITIIIRSGPSSNGSRIKKGVVVGEWGADGVGSPKSEHYLLKKALIYLIWQISKNACSKFFRNFIFS